MWSGNGQALFTAECSHKFHFHCISSSVRHGNLVCPICRAVWKELPFQGPLPAADANNGTARVNPLDWPLDDRQQRQQQRVSGARRRSRADSVTRQWQLPVYRSLNGGGVFDDDEQLDLQPENVVQSQDDVDAMVVGSVGITTYTAFPAMEESVAQEEFAILIHLKAPSSPAPATSRRAPVDLVCVLDVSWSMAGTKLALLKRAVGFVIRTLGPSDRLSVVTFSSAARRLFPLKRMTEAGRQRALQKVNSLVADGGTNIADALKKATRVMEDRWERNPVCSIVLLSDGRDTYSVPAPLGGGQTDYSVLVPSSLLPGGAAQHVQVHAFGFGADHDSPAMHSIAEMSGGTFSFIDAAGSIQDAFAQCIGGLLSVVAQELRLSVECDDDGVLLSSLISGGYASHVDGDGRGGFIDVGDLYADEERDFLVTVRVPAARGESALITPSCTYRNTVTMETRSQTLQPAEVVMATMSRSSPALVASPSRLAASPPPRRRSVRPTWSFPGRH
uniref:VWFA domain-containing protein n=1 Tax=Oryza brachyantha TaxID=4533 RepID=J3N383_ORYBR